MSCSDDTDFPHHSNKTFRNPILDDLAPAPFITKYQGFYYMVATQWNHNNRIEILKSPILSNFRDAERSEIFRGPPTKKILWAPELHQIQGDLYIYFSMGSGSADHRMYVIKCLDPVKNPMGKWSSETRLLPEEDIYATHGTILQYYNQSLYFIWAGHSVSTNSINLYIAKMENPMKVIGPRKVLRRPTMLWEMQGYPVNEAPFIIQNDDRTYLVFSASHCSSPDYCLGIMGIDGGKDPMLVTNWWNDVYQPIFARNDEEGVWAPGHACFVTSPDDSELWIVYDAWDDINDNGRNRKVRIQKIEWQMNTPVFPAPMGCDKDLEVPRGE